LAVGLFCRLYAQAGVFFCVPLPPPTVVQPPHHTENEVCCIWKNAAVKQRFVRSLPFKTKRFIAAVKKPSLLFHTNWAELFQHMYNL
jgi:hypothetical protein